MRHSNHDYTSAGGYFITSVLHNRVSLLARIKEGRIELSAAGRIVSDCWRCLPAYYPRVTLDAFQIMPDHVHGILILAEPNLLDIPNAKATSLSEIMRGFKSMSGRRVNKHLNRQGQPVWQSGFNDRIIRTDGELTKYRNYILTNPLR